METRLSFPLTQDAEVLSDGTDVETDDVNVNVDVESPAQIHAHLERTGMNLQRNDMSGVIANDADTESIASSRAGESIGPIMVLLSEKMTKIYMMEYPN